jgi:luciferase family oxidoreductase group 1
MKMKLSVLDLCPILSGQAPEKSYQDSLLLAQKAEELGYERFWLAEHHNMAGIGSSAPEAIIPFIASGTKKIRVGSGGIMLPNHATLHMAEVFRTLEALYPHRIDFGVGRAPGSGSKAAHLLRGSRGLSAENFPSEFDQLMRWFQYESQGDVFAIPKDVKMPEIWVLGSSDFGALFAANRGLAYSFAQHFSHLPATEMLRLYHENFHPSPWLDEPRAMMAVHIICAETDEEATELALSHELSFSLFVNTGKSNPLPSVEEARAYPYTEEDWKHVRMGSMPKFVGSPATIKRLLKPYLDTKLFEEVMVLTMVYDQEKRRRSYELLADIF